jgi:5-(carboxyamino)imidazole ribonucleotide mutase
VVIHIPKVAVVMGSKSDWEFMRECVEVLKQFGVDVEVRVVSAHRTPDFMFEYVRRVVDEGVEVIIAGAGGAAALPGMIAALTHIPVIGVPIPSKYLNGLDSLLSIVQMPYGVPVATVGVGNSRNAALLALRILSIKYPQIGERLREFMKVMRDEVLSTKLEL